MSNTLVCLSFVYMYICRFYCLFVVVIVVVCLSMIFYVIYDKYTRDTGPRLKPSVSRRRPSVK